MRSTVSATTLAAYERWAPLYEPEPHNPLMRAEQRAMLECWPRATAGSALDLACGTGRYSRLLQASGVARIVSLDFSAAMLARMISGTKVRADMMRLPFADASFDLVVSGLAAGHASSFRRWVAEVVRVLDRGGTFLYSDFHPEATKAGIVRAFKDRDQRTCKVPHRRYDTALQGRVMTAAGLNVETVQEIRVGVQMRETFPGCEDFYRRWHGVPIVLVVRARK